MVGMEKRALRGESCPEEGGVGWGEWVGQGGGVVWSSNILRVSVSHTRSRVDVAAISYHGSFPLVFFTASPPRR